MCGCDQHIDAVGPEVMVRTDQYDIDFRYYIIIHLIIITGVSGDEYPRAWEFIRDIIIFFNLSVYSNV